MAGTLMTLVPLALLLPSLLALGSRGRYNFGPVSISAKPHLGWKPYTRRADTEAKPHFGGIDPDIFRPTPVLIAEHGYPAETHEVTTDDGYILTIHRIPHGRHSTNSTRPAPVLLQHGLLSSSSDWIMNTPEKALAYRLADDGYDVWMGNARGNTYSKAHVNMSTSDSRYWMFSWDEMGRYDVPAVIDYILQATGHEDLYYVGHSMGTTMFWVMMDDKPEYNSKIRLMSGLGPVATVGHMKSPIRLLAPFCNSIDWLLEHIGVDDFLPSDAFMKALAELLCTKKDITSGLCDDILFLLAGFDKAQLNETALPVIIAHTPAGTSTRTVVHYAQEIDTGLFQFYDFGKRENLKKYGKEKPPEYDLGKVTSKVALFWADNDWLADPTDVHYLADQLPDLVLKYRVPLTHFNHLDFLWAIDADTLLYDKVMEMMQQY